MKILFLNPLAQPQDPALMALRNQGYILLYAANREEAFQILALHGSTVDLAIVHREADGLNLIQQIKANPTHADLPILLTSSEWGDAEFAQHQSTTEGVNAYCKFPFIAKGLTQLADLIFGVQNTPPPPVETHFNGSVLKPPSDSLILQEASEIFEVVTNSESSECSIQLEAPDVLDQSAQALSLPSGFSEGVSPPEEVSALDFSQPAIDLSIPPEAISEIPVSVAEPFSKPPVFEEFVEEMPYISAALVKDPLDLIRPVGDSVVPGGAAQSPDTETLKKYLYLREQDVSILSSQLKSSRDQIKALDQSIREERARNVELNHVASEQKRRIEDFEKEKLIAVGGLETEIGELKFQLKTKSDKARLLEVNVKEATGEIDRLKERVRSDIRKIRVREKELENKLEILKKDSEALIGAREGKIMELKRKLDLLEFNMDLLQDQYVREKENSAKLRELFAKAAQVVRVAGGILDSNGIPVDTAPADEDTKSSREAS